MTPNKQTQMEVCLWEFVGGFRERMNWDEGKEADSQQGARMGESSRAGAEQLVRTWKSREDTGLRIFQSTTNYCIVQGAQLVMFNICLTTRESSRLYEIL